MVEAWYLKMIACLISSEEASECLLQPFVVEMKKNRLRTVPSFSRRLKRLNNTMGLPVVISLEIYYCG